MEEGKLKNFIKNNFIYIIIFIACISYIAYGMVNIVSSEKTLIEIFGEGLIILFFGWSICSLFSLQGMISADKKEEVINTNRLHTSLVASIDPVINKMDKWCEEQNTKTLKTIRTRILNSCGLRYDDCFDNEGIAKEVDFSLIKYPNVKEFEDKQKYKNEKLKVELLNKKLKQKEKAFTKAIKVKITPLSTDLITAVAIKNNDPNNLGINRKQFQKKEVCVDLLSKLIVSIVFSYFTVSFVIGYEFLISSIIQVAIFLLMGGIKFLQSYYFVTEDLRKRTIRQINFIQKFKCDITFEENKTVEVENE